MSKADRLADQLQQSGQLRIEEHDVTQHVQTPRDERLADQHSRERGRPSEFSLYRPLLDGTPGPADGIDSMWRKGTPGGDQ